MREIYKVVATELVRREDDLFTFEEPIVLWKGNQEPRPEEIIVLNAEVSAAYPYSQDYRGVGPSGPWRITEQVSVLPELKVTHRVGWLPRRHTVEVIPLYSEAIPDL